MEQILRNSGSYWKIVTAFLSFNKHFESSKASRRKGINQKLHNCQSIVTESERKWVKSKNSQQNIESKNSNM